MLYLPCDCTFIAMCGDPGPVPLNFMRTERFVYLYCGIPKSLEDVQYVEDTHKHLLNDLIEFQK